MVLEKSLVAQFYKDKSVFVTGGTGFVGMVIIEKLLYSCSNVKNIYMLVKPKNGKSIQERLEEIFSLEAFQRLKEYNPEAFKKIIPISGDLVEDGMGICEEDVKTLRKEVLGPRIWFLLPLLGRGGNIRKNYYYYNKPLRFNKICNRYYKKGPCDGTQHRFMVSIVIHSAASINFVVPLEQSININAISTVKMLELAKTMQNLQAFVYVSTAFSNSNIDVIDERVYDTEIPVSCLNYVLEELKDNPLSKSVTGRWPNSYTYSKSLAEMVVATKAEFPTAIVRPSIISAAREEPTPGWLHGWNGLSRALASISEGSILVWHGDEGAVFDVIPVDVVVNLTIVAAWDVCRKRSSDNESSKVKVFNCTTGLQNPITVGQLFYTGLEYGINNNKRKGISKLLIIKNHKLWQTLFFLLQVIPAYIISGITFLFGDWGRSVKIMRKARRLIKAVGGFTQHQFLFVDHNVRQLHLDLNATDKETFNFDVKSIDWQQYNVHRFMFGVRKYLQRF